MKNKVVLVTGSSNGIGAKVIEIFAKNGYDVVINYNKNKQSALDLQKKIEKYKINSLVVKCDISQQKEVEIMVDKIKNKFGKIDVLVNNAGIAIDCLFCDKTIENFKKTIETNLIGTFIVSKIVGEMMVNNKSGKIINIASTNGINTYYPMCADYDASKAGIISLTHNLALQFAPYINVNAVAPGFIATLNETKDMDEEFIKLETEKILLKRAGKEEDVANLILFLASEKASFINNEVIRIDGGIYGNY